MKTQIKHPLYFMKVTVALVKTSGTTKKKKTHLGEFNNCYFIGRLESIDKLKVSDIRIQPLDPKRKSYKIGDVPELSGRIVKIRCYRSSELGIEDKNCRDNDF